MYKKFYGFTELPFNITPDPKYLFFSSRHQEAYNYLVYGIENRKGFIQLTGEVGAGKTTLCRALLNELENEKYETALIVNPVLTKTQMLKAILREFEVEKISEDHFENYEILNEYLLKLADKNICPVLIIDESQNLSPEMLEQIRLLSNLETNAEKLIQIVLLGQPELRTMLNNPGLRQLRQRITVRYHLEVLSEEDVARYLDHRMTIAGGKGNVHFDKTAVRRIYKYSSGIPRLINALADKSLLAGYVYSKNVIDVRTVKRAERELEGEA